MDLGEIMGNDWGWIWSKHIYIYVRHFHRTNKVLCQKVQLDYSVSNKMLLFFQKLILFLTHTDVSWEVENRDILIIYEQIFLKMICSLLQFYFSNILVYDTKTHPWKYTMNKITINRESYMVYESKWLWQPLGSSFAFLDFYFQVIFNMEQQRWPT